MEKLGLRKHRYIQKDYETEMDQTEKDAFDENARNNVEYKKRADEIIKEATDKANDMKKKCDIARAEVEKLKDDNAKMADELDYMRGGEKRIEDDFNKKIEDMRTK